jgi:hypothetical protein
MRSISTDMVVRNSTQPSSSSTSAAPQITASSVQHGALRPHQPSPPVRITGVMKLMRNNRGREAFGGMAKTTGVMYMANCSDHRDHAADVRVEQADRLQ